MITWIIFFITWDMIFNMENTENKLDISNIIIQFFKDKSKEYGVNELNLFIENMGDHLSLNLFDEYGESCVIEQTINKF